MPKHVNEVSRALGDMTITELEAHVAELQAKIAACERRRDDTRLMTAHHVRRLWAETEEELRFLRMDLQSTEFTIKHRQAGG
jgi:hypothetical protein